MGIFRHRVMSNCDLAFDVITHSADTTLDELEIRARQVLRQVTGDQACCLADLGFDVSLLPAGRFYPRVEHRTPNSSCETDADVRLRISAPRTMRNFYPSLFSFDHPVVQCHSTSIQSKENGSAWFPGRWYPGTTNGWTASQPSSVNGLAPFRVSA